MQWAPGHLLFKMCVCVCVCGGGGYTRPPSRRSGRFPPKIKAVIESFKTNDTSSQESEGGGGGESYFLLVPEKGVRGWGGWGTSIIIGTPWGYREWGGRFCSIYMSWHDKQVKGHNQSLGYMISYTVSTDSGNEFLTGSSENQKN